MFDMQKMLKQAQKLQDQMEQAQEELGKIDVTGTAGGGSVSITCDCKFDFKQVKISPDALKDTDAETLEDLVLSALKDVAQKIQQTTEQKMSGITSGLNIPGLKLPGF